MFVYCAVKNKIKILFQKADLCDLYKLCNPNLIAYMCLFILYFKTI